MSTFKNLKLLFCASGIFFSFLFYGIYLEKITKTKYGIGKEKFEYFLCLLFSQCIINGVIALLATLVSSRMRRIVWAPFDLSFCACALCYIGAMLLSTYSLRHVSYPFQIIGKSCKPLPIMLLGFLWAGTRYPLRKVVLVFALIAGVVLFMYDSSSSKHSKTHFSWSGVICLGGSLLMDGFVGGIQDKLRKKYGSNLSKFLFMFKMNFFALFYLAIPIYYNQEASAFLNFLERFPHVKMDILYYGICSAIGQLFIYTTIVEFGPLTTSIVTTTRKFMSVLFSNFYFGHSMSNQQWFGTFLVFGALGIDNFLSSSSKKNSKSDSKSD